MPHDQIRSALAELVRLKDIKDRAEVLYSAGPLSDAGENWESEYDRLRAVFYRLLVTIFLSSGDYHQSPPKTL